MSSDINTNGLNEQEGFALAMHVLQEVADRYGWSPNWHLQEEGEKLLHIAKSQSESVKQILTSELLQPILMRMAVNRYCALWYVACLSVHQAEQQNAFHALHAYLFRTARYLAITQYQLNGDYAEQIASESAQAALINLWQNLHNVRDPGRFLGYAKQIIVRETLHNIKQAEKTEFLEEVSGNSTNALFQKNDPEDIPKERHSLVAETIRHCLRSKEQQQVIILSFLQNKTLEQIAEILGKKPGTIRVLKHRALERLRTCEEMRKLMASVARERA